MHRSKRPLGSTTKSVASHDVARSPASLASSSRFIGSLSRRLMRRREFIAGLGSAAVWPVMARAQQPQVRRIGVLLALAADDPEGKAQTAGFLQGLAQLGWIDGRNVRIDYRWGFGNVDNIRKSAAELGCDPK
jgi:hypothetical protein